MSQRKYGTILSFLSIALRFIIALAYTPIMLSLLGKTEYGLLNFAGSVISYLGLFSFGFSGAYMRFYSRYKVNNDSCGIAKLNGLFLIVYIFFSIIVLFAGSILIYNADILIGNQFSKDEISTVKILLSILVLSTTITFITPVFDSYISANEKFIFQRGLQIVGQILSPLICIPVLLMGFKSIGLIIAMTIAGFSIKILMVVYCYKFLEIKFNFKQLDLSLLKEIAVFSSFIFFNMITDQINWNVDKFLIGRFRGPIEVAEYSLAAQFNAIYLSISIAISSVFAPTINMDIANKRPFREIDEIFTRIGRLQFILLSFICTIFIFFGKEFIILWVGFEYINSYIISLFLLIPVTFPLIQNLGIEIQKAYNKHKFRSLVYFIIAISNIIISIPLIKIYGGVGAAIGTAISLIIGNVIIMNIYYHIKLNLNVFNFWWEIVKFLPALTFPCMFALLYSNLLELDKLINFIIGVFAFTLIFSISFWMFGMNPYEKKIMRTTFFKISKNTK